MKNLLTSIAKSAILVLSKEKETNVMLLNEYIENEETKPLFIENILLEEAQYMLYMVANIYIDKGKYETLELLKIDRYGNSTYCKVIQGYYLDVYKKYNLNLGKNLKRDILEDYEKVLLDKYKLKCYN